MEIPVSSCTENEFSHPTPAAKTHQIAADSLRNSAFRIPHYRKDLAMPKYLVKTKYTYEKIRQTDYTYAPENWALSQNQVAGRFIYEQAEAIGTFTLTTGAVPVEVTLTPAQAARFAEVSGFMIAQGEGEGMLCRVTLWGTAGESFASVCYLTEAPRLFSTAKMGFVPVRMTLETRPYDAQWDRPETEIALSFGYVLNTLGEVGGQAHFYEVESDTNGEIATLTDDRGAMIWTLDGETRLSSPVFPDSSDTVYNMKMPRRNTVMMVITNRSTAKRLTLTFATTTHPWGNNGAVGLELSQDGEPHAYYFNLSALPQYCDGRMAQFILSAEGTGDIIIHRYTFEQEKPIREVGCEVISCTADLFSETVTVKGRLLDTAALARLSGGRLSLYTATMADEQDAPAGKRLVASVPLAGGEFVIEDIPLRDECTTLLPYQFALFAEKDGDFAWLCDRFYIENYEDFDRDPYAFVLPDYTVSVCDFGARGDGFTNDTVAIQAAIDHVSAAGGGKIILPGSPDRYGRRYVATSLLLPSMVELCIETGATLWQSQLKDDYDYEVTYGHDGVIPGINWTHCLHVCNLPLIQAANVHHVRIAGGGSVRMMDTGSEEGVGMPGYATGCPDRIHCIPIGFFLVDDCECRDFEIIRSNNYHTEYNHCRRVSLQNLCLHEVKCVSGDGFGMAGGKQVFVNRCFFQSNDDGIVMSTHMHDPRGILWWTNMVGEDNSCRDIRVLHSYLNSGGGKALAFITWGTSDPDQSLEEIDGVAAYDNYLISVNPVGTWPDNPYNGKQPFDNSETDDYSPVKNVRIFGNRYEGNCTLGPIACTNVLTDCGVHSASQFRNGDFTLGGMANWTLFPNNAPDSVHSVIYADKEKGCIERFDQGSVAAAQGLHLLCGSHRARLELLTGREGATVYATRIQTGEVLAKKTFVCPRLTAVSLSFTVTDMEADVFIGVRSAGTDPAGYAVFDRFVLHSVVDEAGIAAARREKFLTELNRRFLPAEDMEAFAENGKMLLSVKADKATVLLPVRGDKCEFTLEAAIRADHYDPASDSFGFGYRFAIREGGASFRELRFNAARRTLTLTDVTPEGERELYRREHFFFTSNDFHIFRIMVMAEDIAVWIDGSQYAIIPARAVLGGAALMVTDAHVSVSSLGVTE